MRSAKDSSGKLWTPDPASVRLGAVQAIKGIVNFDTVQVAHPRRLTVAQVNVLSQMTGGCRCGLSNPPHGSSFVVNGQSVRYHFITKIQNPPRQALEWLQETQDAPIVITQADLAADLFYEDLEALCASWTLIERYPVCGRLGANTRFWANGSYVNACSQIREMSIYLKRNESVDPALRVEILFRSTRGLNVLLRIGGARQDDHISLNELYALHRVDTFLRCLRFMKLNERRSGQRLAGQSIGGTSMKFGRNPVDALKTLNRLTLSRSHSLADQEFRDDELTTPLFAAVLRDVAPQFTTRYFDSLDPQLVGIPSKSKLRVGELLP